MEPTDAETASSVDVPYLISSEQHVSIVNTSKKIIINLGNKKKVNLTEIGNELQNLRLEVNTLKAKADEIDIMVKTCQHK